MDFALETPLFHDNYNKDYLLILKQILICYQLKEYNWENLVSAYLNVLKEYMLSCGHRKKSTYVELSCKIIPGHKGHGW